MSHSIRRGLIVIFLLIGNAGLHAQQPEWSDVQQDIESAVTTTDAEALMQLETELSNADLDPAAWKSYWIAYAAYRRGLFSDSSDERKSAWKDCAEAAGRALESGAASGESLALRGTCFNMLAGTGPQAGMRFGSRASADITTALADAPDNPRALLAAGTQDLYTPVQWGGDKERAVRRLQRALDAFEAGLAEGRVQPWLPTWGYVDAHGQLAIALHRLDRGVEARAVLARASEAGLRSDWLDRIGTRIESE